MIAESDKTEIIDLLDRGRMELDGLVQWGSNYTFLVRIVRDSEQIEAIYKPSRGERPLWDFSRGTLCLRERAAYLVSDALGWDLVPPTILREGPHGWGSVQYFVAHDPNEHYLTFQEHCVERGQQIALFDVLINNADRKSGHVIWSEAGHVWAIDHGVSFHSEYKLRSVIWDFAGETIPTELLADLKTFRTQLENGKNQKLIELSQLLEPQEFEAMKKRLEGLITGGIFPNPGPGRHYPWPLI